MALEHITDHEARAADRLVEQFKNKTNIVALLKSWAAQIQELEDAGADLLVQRTLAGAFGTYLDVLGELVGQAREGRADPTYRIWIAARVLVNRSSGLTEQIIAIAEKLVGAGKQVRLEAQYPAAFVLHVDDAIDALEGVEIAKLIVLASAAGVGAQFHWFRTDGGTFAFSSDGSQELNSPLGFDEGEFSAVSDGRSMGYFPDYDPPATTDDLVVIL